MSRCLVGQPQLVGVEAFRALRAAARDSTPVSGLTHRFYRYPARFSPTFAGTAIDLLSKPGDLILDPYMGGGTAVVEAVARGREIVGNDINTLSVFVTRVKTTPLTPSERVSLAEWADTVVPTLSYWDSPKDLLAFVADRRTHNLTLPHARPVKKVIALALRSLRNLRSDAARELARCALLNVGQLFLNGQRRSCSVSDFRDRLQGTVHEMIDAIAELGSCVCYLALGISSVVD